MSRIGRIVSAACVAGLVLACDSPTEDLVASIAMTLQSTQASTSPGTFVDVALSISRVNFDGPVTLTTGELPAGVSVSFNPSTIPAGATTSMATIEVSNFAQPADISIQIVAKGSGAQASAAFAVKIAVTGSYSLALHHPTITMAQGGGGGTTVFLSREKFAGLVTLSAASLPSGIEAVFESAVVTGGSAELSLTAAPTAATGSQQIIVTGKASGLPDVTTALTVDIIAPPPTTTVRVKEWCVTPTWVGYRNEGYGWKQATVVGDSVTIPAADRLAFAQVFVRNNGVWTYVYYLTRDELVTRSGSCDGPGSRTLSGSVAGLTSAQRAAVIVGPSDATATQSTPSFTLQGIPSSPVDMLAIRRPFTGPWAADWMIIRRALDLPSGSVIPTIDFATEGFAPLTSTLSLSGVNPEDTTTPVVVTLWTATANIYMQSGYRAPSASSVSFVSVPPANMLATDLHELEVEGTRVEDPNLSSYAVLGRIHKVYYTTTGDRSLALGPYLSVPALSVIASTPYQRPRALIPSQPQYPTLAVVYFYQNASEVAVTVTSAYLQGTPTTWDIAVPHFGSAAGYNGSWGLGSGVGYRYQAQVWGGPSTAYFGDPKHGDFLSHAYRDQYSSPGSPPTSQPGGVVRTSPRQPGRLASGRGMRRVP